jgi:hypothetical protein
MTDAGTHIATWEAAGLIDAATADRLRAADFGDVAPLHDVAIAERPKTPGGSGASALFGPTVTIAEVFGYLGTAFLLAAWFALIARQAAGGSDPATTLGVGWAIAAIALTGLGAFLLRGDDRRRRGAGVAFLVGSLNAGAAAASLASGNGIEWPLVGVVGSAVALAVAIGMRSFHPAVLTQIGGLLALTSLAATLLAWLEQVLFPADQFDGSLSPATGPDPIVLVLASATWWIAVAVFVGLIGLRESHDAGRRDDAAAARRAGTSRLWAGLVAIIGLATAVTRSDFTPDGSFGRVLEPWVGDVALLIVAGVLIERAFRREATSYIYAAALGLIIALSDFNLTYLSDSTETALFVEGLILLGAGIAADRLRRRVGRPDDPPAATPGEGDVVPARG